MNSKILQGLLIAALSIASLVFVVMGDLELAVLFMTVMFVLTNGIRYKQMKEKGMDREAKWMLGMSVIFVVLFFVVLATILL